MKLMPLLMELLNKIKITDSSIYTFFKNKRYNNEKNNFYFKFNEKTDTFTLHSKNMKFNNSSIILLAKFGVAEQYKWNITISNLIPTDKNKIVSDNQFKTILLNNINKLGKK